MFILKNIVRGKNKMAKEKKEKLNVMSCKCEVSDSSSGETAVLKNCKCKPVGRKERSYDSLIIEKSN